MSILGNIKRLINVPLQSVGMEMVRRGSWIPYDAVRFPSDIERISHAASLGFTPKVVYDGGGFDGQWCKKVSSVFPNAEFVMFEPNPNMKARIIDNIAPIKTRVQLVQKALADKPGTAQFNIWKSADNDASASLLGHVQGDASTQLEVELTTIDSVAEETGKWPDLIKLDLQGAEGPALEGAVKALEKAEMVIAEFGVLNAYKDRTSCTELLRIMEESDFHLYDIVDMHYRPYDGALTGGDFFFVKGSSKLKAYAGYD